MQKTVVAEWRGYCPICRSATTFRAEYDWFRDHLLCESCGSIPRERALMVVIDRLAPNWRDMKIHESSPGGRGVSHVLRRDCRRYVPSQFFPDASAGSVRKGVRCENLEHQTFEDEAFDLVITQDVMEHVFHPDKAYREIARTLKPGGFHIHTTPIYKDLQKSERRAELLPLGNINYLFEAEYHGSPVGDGRSLVTWHYGHDLPELIRKWAPSLSVEVTRFNDPPQGLVAEFLDVIVCRKT
jgi:SAM-dependent methyltransferase